MRLLVTRPLPGAEASAAHIRALGHEAILAPLLATEPLDWQSPSPMPEALMLTSAAALQHGGQGLAMLHGLPTYVVGTATAAAARGAGFGDVRVGAGTAQALVEAIAAAGVTSILHVGGADRTPVSIPAGLYIVHRTAYRARLQPLNELPTVDHVLLYSIRTALQFATEIHRLGGRRDRYRLAAISTTVLAAAGTGWGAGIAAPAPDEDALLAAIGLTCQKTGE